MVCFRNSSLATTNKTCDFRTQFFSHFNIIIRMNTFISGLPKARSLNSRHSSPISCQSCWTTSHPAMIQMEASAKGWNGSSRENSLSRPTRKLLRSGLPSPWRGKSSKKSAKKRNDPAEHEDFERCGRWDLRRRRYWTGWNFSMNF